MAIGKNIKIENGLTLTYHRVYSVVNNINSSIDVCVMSYVNQNDRTMEKENSETVYSSLTVYNTNRTADVYTASDAYDFLKSLPEFEGAIDILEGES